VAQLSGGIEVKNPFTIDEMKIIVVNVLAQVLGLSSDEIDENHALVDDLDVDSLDFVEINATLEKLLNISFDKKGVLEHAGKISGRPDLFYSAKGGLTDEGVNLLKNSLSKFTQLRPGMTTHDVFNKTTVLNLANFCHGLFDHLPETCPQCSGEEAVRQPAGKVVCANCNAPLLPLSGEAAQARHLSMYLKDGAPAAA
jgi:acyl carrier protein